MSLPAQPEHERFAPFERVVALEETTPAADQYSVSISDAVRKLEKLDG